MEEVDNIILVTLKDLGCHLPKTLTNMGAFDADNLLRALCVISRVIAPSIELPEKIPSQMGPRFNLANQLTKFVTDLGFQGKLTFELLLYPNAADTRKMFSFLIGQLPQAAGADEEQVGRDTFQRGLLAALSSATARSWQPTCLRKPQRNASFAAWKLDMPVSSAAYAKEAQLFFSSRLLPATAQPPPSVCGSAPSLLERSAGLVAEQELSDIVAQQDGAVADSLKRRQERFARGFGAALRSELQEAGTDAETWKANRQRSRGMGEQDEANSRFTRNVDMQDQAEPAVEDQAQIQRDREARLAAAEARFKELEKLIQSLEAALDQAGLSKRQLVGSDEDLRKRLVALNTEHRLKTQMAQLAQDLDGNMEKLRALVQQSAQRIANLGRQWEEHRVPLISGYRQAKAEVASRQSHLKMLLERRAKAREEMQQLIQAARDREEQCQQLQSEYDKLNKDVNRIMYTRRIMEIIKNVKKQQVDIDKILIDIHNLRKEINSINDTLSRSFTATDELVFKEAKKGDEVTKQLYKQVIDLNAVRRWKYCLLLLTIVRASTNSSRPSKKPVQRSPPLAILSHEHSLWKHVVAL
eukprot:TRINITY_DN914_c0_g1_i1.p1 TRINITY_DN914_c0_g1~~TRINITY_DN914_c0_g1_i1.p1  ORF type:complete len:598 (+),score=124.78 TRINITY_DN914_c0_g1_i1:44-1795(+)